jgi:site-specific DNA-methyltransferase (adenine-specific)
MTIYHSAWQDAAWPETVDCIITDPPYSARTHTGNDGGRRATRDPKRDPAAKWPSGSGPIRQLDYAALTPDEAHAWGREWARRARSWVAVLTDSELMHAWQSGFKSGGMYAFAPVPCVITGMTCRLTGDGPSSWAVYLMVARSKAAAKWGTLPGAYVVTPEPNRAESRIGGKPLSLMRQIVRDYSRPGMVVADPCCGYGTTLIAAAEQGRTVWGCDTDAESVKRTRERLETVKAQPQLFEAATQLEIA